MLLIMQAGCRLPFVKVSAFKFQMVVILISIAQAI